LLLALDAVLVIWVIPGGPANPREKLDIRGLLLNRSMVVPAVAITVAAFAVGIIEPLLPVRLARDGITPGTTGLIFTISTIVYGLSAPVVGRISSRFSINKVMIAGAIAMAGTLPLLAAFQQASLVCLAVALVYISFAFMLNPASAELGNVVDRAGASCYSAAYALYNIVYSAGMLGIAALAPAAAHRVGLLGALLCVSAVLLLSIPLLLKESTPV
jgi:MFS family permease